jgi:hypothetical protein
MSLTEYQAPNKHGRYRPLPPPEVWLDNPYQVWCPTIVDERGIPKPDETLEQVLSLLAPGYRGIKNVNTNHFAYPDYLYPNLPSSEANPHEYRNQTPLTRLMPIDIHNFLHLMLEPPPRPSKEVMSYSIEAWRVAKRLFNQARVIRAADDKFEMRVRDLKNNPGMKDKVSIYDDTDLEYLIDNLDKRLRGFDERIEAYEGLPHEFKLAEIDPNLEPVQLANQIVVALGKIVMPQIVRPAAIAEAA